jgi:CRISPR-associated protein Cas5d
MCIVDVKVWGDYACFTAPESKVERVSYPVMTPAAARGILEAIYWKPQFYYRVRSIGVLRFGTQWSLLRNELSSRQNKDAKGIGYARQVLADPNGQVERPGKGKTKAQTADEIARRQFTLIDDDRQQRTSHILQDVAYRIKGWICLRPGENPATLGKHLDCFRRKVKHGQCFQKPYLGCREFAADFAPAVEDRDVPDMDLYIPIGTMLFDTAYVEDRTWYEKHPQDRIEFWRQELGTAPPRIARGYAKRLFFHAEVERGWLNVPQAKYEALDKLEGRNGIS